MFKFICNLFRREPSVIHIWKVEKEENLGSYVDYGHRPEDICTMYRIAVYEKCLITGLTRISERIDLFPIKENQ